MVSRPDLILQGIRCSQGVAGPWRLEMAVDQQSRTAELQAAREKYVARGLYTQDLFVERAHGCRIWDVDGREYIDFAGGIGTLNGGHTPEAVVDAIKQQAEQYLHQCVSVGDYEPYVQVCKRLLAAHPGDGPFKALLQNSGAEAVENAIKIARYATGRPAVICFEHGFHGRTLLGMTLTSKLSYKKGMGPFAPEVYRAVGAVPVPGCFEGRRRLRVPEDVQEHRRRRLGRCRDLRADPGRGRLPPGAGRVHPGDLRGSVRISASSTSTTRSRPACAAPALWPPPSTSASPRPDHLGQVDRRWDADLRRLRASRPDGSVHPGGLGGTYGGHPLSCAAAIVAPDQALDPAFQARSAALGKDLRARLNDLATRIPRSARCVASAQCSRSSWCRSRDQGAGLRLRGPRARDGAGARPDRSQHRDLRERHPHPRADRGLRGGSERGLRDPRRRAARRCLELRLHA